EQLDRLGDVVSVVGDRVCHRVRHHDLGRAVHHCTDVRVLGEDPGDQGLVGDVTDVERGACGELLPAGGQVVQDHHVPALVPARQADRAADVPRTTGDQYFHVAFPVSPAAHARCCGS